uniref:Gamma-glutamylcyclotransferase n=1 Tax=Cyprinus carpio TaxID=7962 RepID=A0A8C2IN48_CYPCA
MKLSSHCTFLMRFFRLRYLRHSRLQLKNPSAVVFKMQRTQYYLGKKVYYYIFPSNYRTVWLDILCIYSFTDLSKEQVDEGVYSPLEVKVETKEGPLLCRTYKMNNFRPCLPSAQYKKVVCLGAQQNGLPQNYIQKLLALKTNNYSGTSILDQITDWILESYTNTCVMITMGFVC